MNPTFESLVASLGENGAHSEAAFAKSMRGREITPSQCAALARRLANSGARLDTDPNAITVASTGGPASLTTLIPQLQLAAIGVRTAVIGVPGRPAGATDILACIPGFDLDLAEDAAEQARSMNRAVHLEAGGRWCPLDARLFRARQAEGVQSHFGLVCASLLSKALAAGSGTLILDVRVGLTGNFGRSLGEARENLDYMMEVAAELGVTLRASITDSDVPRQPYIGRLEALTALREYFAGRAGPWLLAHIRECSELVQAAPSPADVHEAFLEMVAVHGGDVRYVDRHLPTPNYTPLVVNASGVLSWNLADFRDIFSSPEGGLNPAGCILSEQSGSKVHAGQAAGLIRGISADSWRRMFTVAEGGV